MSAGSVTSSGKSDTGRSRTLRRTIEIPSFGLEYFEYRRRLFLAGKPIPIPPDTLPATYTVPWPLPESLPARSQPSSASDGIARLESLLSVDGDLADNIAWKAGIGNVHHALTEKRRLTIPIRLDLVIQILRAAWVRDGTWPIDPKTKRPLDPPDSPVMEPVQPVLSQPAKTTRLDPLEESESVDGDRAE